MPYSTPNPPGPIEDVELSRRIHEALERTRAAWADIIRSPITTDRQTPRPGSRDTDEMPEDRAGIRCLNCGHYWIEHSGWACFDYWRSDPNHSRSYSELDSGNRYLTPDMPNRKNKKFSRVSRRKLQKLEREHLQSKESLLK